MDNGDLENVNGNPRSQHPNITTVTFSRVKFGCCNLEFPYTFIESTGIIYNQMGMEVLEGLRVSQSQQCQLSRKINKRINSHPIIHDMHLVSLGPASPYPKFG